MKRIIALILIISTLAILILSIASCGGGGSLRGTYVSDDFYGLDISYQFNGNAVTITTFAGSIPGTYKIDGDTLKITMAGEIHTSSFEKVSDEVIIIDGIEYKKK